MLHVNDYRDLGPQLRKLREAAGFSLREVSHFSHLSASTVLSAEKGHHVPRLDTVIFLLNFYQSSISLGMKPQGSGSDNADDGTGH